MGNNDGNEDDLTFKPPEDTESSLEDDVIVIGEIEDDGPESDKSHGKAKQNEEEKSVSPLRTRRIKRKTRLHHLMMTSWKGETTREKKRWRRVHGKESKKQ
jgi:PHP family Zn ribbon phosphoesterase